MSKSVSVRGHTPDKKLKSLELFAGAGGMALGFEQAGFEPAALIEIDKTAIATLSGNRPKWNVIRSDVALVDLSQFEGVDIVTGGFPCQPFSRAGKKRGFSDRRGGGFKQCHLAVKQLKPSMFVFENVKGLVEMEDGAILTRMLSQLTALGYIVEHRVLKAVEHGVPQNRERVFIVGRKLGMRFEYPYPDARTITLREALANTPVSSGVGYSVVMKQLLEDVPPGGCWRALHPYLQDYYLEKSHKSGGQTSMLRRLRWDKPCPTLTTFPSDRRICRCHPSDTRPLTVREYARIQTFPDSWHFEGSVTSQYRQIGNAVPVELARRVAESCFKSFFS